MTDRYQRLIHQLRTLMDLSALVNSTLDSSEIERRSVEAAARLVDAERGSLLLLDPDTGDLCFEVALGDADGTLKEIRLLKGQGIAGWVAEQGEGVIIHDVQHDPRFFKDPDAKGEFVTRDMICAPVLSRNCVVGVLQAINKIHGEFEENDLEMLTALGHQVAVAVENARLYRELKEAFYETAEALANTIEKRDPYTGGHTRRVMEYSLTIGAKMGLDDAELEDLRLAAILHDIGKIGVPDCVLQKPGRLDDDEFATMRGHAQTAADILSSVHRLAGIVPAVRAHHERPDGKGYPDGLRGDDIPFAARIIAVADTFDAMVTDRPYRKGLPLDVAADELRKWKGQQFDERCVEAFLSCVEAFSMPMDDDTLFTAEGA